MLKFLRPKDSGNEELMRVLVDSLIRLETYARELEGKLNGLDSAVDEIKQDVESLDSRAEALELTI